MSQINNNISSLINLNNLRSNNNTLNTTLQQLSTGLRINRGQDDPAGLIAAEVLGAELRALDAAVANNERANSVINTAEGALSEISNLLVENQGLAVQASNSFLSSAERDAIQGQIDSNLNAIDRISNTASFNGQRLFNGSQDFTTTGQGAEVVDADVIATAGALPEDGLDINVNVTETAQQAAVALDFGDTSLSLSSSEETFDITVEGAEGGREFSFADGATLDDVAETINNASDQTGVTATVSGNTVRLDSDDFGSDEFVSVEITDDGGQTGTVSQTEAENTEAADPATSETFADLEGAGEVRDTGRDVAGTINGQVASGDGLELSVSTDTLEANVELTEAAATATGEFTATTVTGGGATFALSQNLGSVNTITVGLPNLNPNNLGATTVDGERFDLNDTRRGGSASVQSGNFEALQSTLSSAISEVATLRGRLGSVQRNTIEPAINALTTAFENTAASRSQIIDTDFALATANLARDQTLLQSSLLNQGITNSRPSNVLSLLA